MNEIKVINEKFDKKSIDKINDKQILNYPVVYLLNNDKEVYIGETTNVKNRMKSHLNNKKRKKIEQIRIIYNEQFNQSATYNIETKLINYFIADGKYKLQNISQTKQKMMHNYYNKAYYDIELFGEIWNRLKEQQFVDHSLVEIENSDVYKLSPLRTLSEEQLMIKENIISFCNTIEEEKRVYIIEGEAGTGKSVLISSIFNQIQNMSKDQASKMYNMNNYLLVNHGEMIKTYEKMAKSLPNIQKKNVLKPTTFINKNLEADITIVDEAHLLLTSKDTFNNFKQQNQLEEIIKRSKNTIIIYDHKQFLKIQQYWDKKELSEVLLNTKVKSNTYKLSSQMRMNTSLETDKWIDDFVDCKLRKIPKDDNFDLRIFNNSEEMYEQIKSKNDQYGLSRIVSTFDYEHKKDGQDYFVEAGNLRLPWNRIYKESWAELPCTINECGSIYTVQGYDLNYVGVILGPSFKYDKINDCITIDISKYKDKKAFVVNSDFKYKDNQLKINRIKRQIILNSLNILLKRGIKGTYIYAHDEELRKKLSSL